MRRHRARTFLCGLDRSARISGNRLPVNAAVRSIVAAQAVAELAKARYVNIPPAKKNCAALLQELDDPIAIERERVRAFALENTPKFRPEVAFFHPRFASCPRTAPAATCVESGPHVCGSAQDGSLSHWPEPCCTRRPRSVTTSRI
jgi:hypothetical protein